MHKYIKVNELDNVAVALTDLCTDDKITLDNCNFMLKEKISTGHKFTINSIKKGEEIIKYGYCIGVATQDINQGMHVHTHNIKTGLSEISDYEFSQKLNKLQEPITPQFFYGYKRKNGKVGIRNEVWVIPTVGCVNSVAQEIVKQTKLKNANIANDIVAYPHPYGCSQMGDDQENTKQILVNLINHPNAAAVLVLGLGCENSNIDEIKKIMGEYDNNRVKFLQCQDCDDEILQGSEILDELCTYAGQFKREPINVNKLIVGLKCGGSDGLSGITANPAVGVFSDLFIAHGATSILTEVPEMFGAETILMNRCENKEVFDKTVSLINDFKQYYTNHNQVIYENPSPGNKKGGISTLEDKSLGCTQKSGNATVTDVLKYGQIASKNGLNLLSAPGNDLVAATALAASGAHIVLFTTGRGTPFACPVPTVKISSNTALANKKNNWIDFDCGEILSKNKSMQKCANDLFEYVLNIASGEKVKAEIMGYHDFAIFKQGVTL